MSGTRSTPRSDMGVRVPRRLLGRVNYLGVATIATVLVLWEVIVRADLVHFQYLPAPSQIFGGFFQVMATGEMESAVGHTLVATLVGWVCASLVGIALGLLLGLFAPVWRYTMASFEVLRALPIVAFAPVAVLLFGFTTKMEVALSFYAALWPILINASVGVRQASPRLLEVGSVLRLNRAERIWKLRLPAAVPLIVVGLRLGLALALVLSVVAELVGNPAGVGYALSQAQQSLHPAQMFAYVGLLGVIGIALNALLMAAAKALFTGQMASAGENQ